MIDKKGGRSMISDMQLDLQSKKDLLQASSGYGIIFIKVAEDDVRSAEFFSASDGTMRTATFLPSSELHDWIETQYRELKEKDEEVVSKKDD